MSKETELCSPESKRSSFRSSVPSSRVRGVRFPSPSHSKHDLQLLPNSEDDVMEDIEGM